MKTEHAIDWSKSAAEIQDDFERVCKQRDELLADRDTWKTRAEFSYQERKKLENQVEGLINQLSKHQIEAKIGSAVNRACRELPLGYDLHIELEKDAGTVNLYRPDGEKVDEEFHDCDYFSSAIENAINVAIALAEKGIENRECTCGWSGEKSDCLMCGSVGPLCPRCHETTEVREGSAV